jgi:quercetin dioxygenase-like cupin family protein
MALHHAESGEIVDIRPLGKKLKQAISVTLVKTERLQVFRYILLKGKEFPEHKVPGEITVQCLEGVIELTSRDRKKMLQAGEFVYLEGDDLHTLKGIKDASVLVTIVSNKQT